MDKRLEDLLTKYPLVRRACDHAFSSRAKGEPPCRFAERRDRALREAAAFADHATQKDENIMAALVLSRTAKRRLRGLKSVSRAFNESVAWHLGGFWRHDSAHPALSKPEVVAMAQAGAIVDLDAAIPALGIPGVRFGGEGGHIRIGVMARKKFGPLAACGADPQLAKAVQARLETLEELTGVALAERRKANEDQHALSDDVAVHAVVHKAQAALNKKLWNN